MVGDRWIDGFSIPTAPFEVCYNISNGGGRFPVDDWQMAVGGNDVGDQGSLLKNNRSSSQTHTGFILHLFLSIAWADTSKYSTCSYCTGKAIQYIES